MPPQQIRLVRCPLATTTVEGVGDMLVDYDYILRAFQFFEDAPVLLVPIPDPHVTSPESTWPAREEAERLASARRRDGKPFGTVAPCAVFKRDMTAAYANGSIAAHDIVRELKVENPWPPGAIIMFVAARRCDAPVVVAVDYLMMSASADFAYRRSYLLRQLPSKPRLSPRACRVITYDTRPWIHILSANFVTVGEYKPFRWPSETVKVPKPAPPPAPVVVDKALLRADPNNPGYDAYRLLARQHYQQATLGAMFGEGTRPPHLDGTDEDFNPRPGW